MLQFFIGHYPIPKTATDTGSGAESPVVDGIISHVDDGHGTNSAATTADTSGSDAAAGSDGPVPDADSLASDAGAGSDGYAHDADSIATETAAATSDTLIGLDAEETATAASDAIVGTGNDDAGTGSDQLDFAADVFADDAAIGDEAFATDNVFAIDDTATGDDQPVPHANVGLGEYAVASADIPAIDSGTASDALDLLADAASADLGDGGEFLDGTDGDGATIRVAVQDGTGIDVARVCTDGEIPIQTADISAEETGIGLETMLVEAFIDPADTGEGGETTEETYDADVGDAGTVADDPMSAQDADILDANLDALESLETFVPFNDATIDESATADESLIVGVSGDDDAGAASDQATNLFVTDDGAEIPILWENDVTTSDTGSADESTVIGVSGDADSGSGTETPRSHYVQNGDEVFLWRPATAKIARPSHVVSLWRPPTTDTQGS